MYATFTPKFNVNEIMHDFVGKDWFRLQELVNILGEHILSYMQDYINTRSHRDGKTGNLANAITIDQYAGAGEVGWGIGKITTLDQNAPYWYLLNFGGKTFVAQFGLGVGGSFNGNSPDSSKAGTGVGTERFGDGNFVMFPKNPIRPLNYIESSRQKLDLEIKKIILHIKANK